MCWLQALPSAPCRDLPGTDSGQQCPPPHPGTAQASLTTASPGKAGICHFPPSPVDKASPGPTGRILLGYTAVLRDGQKIPSANRTWVGSASPSLHGHSDPAKLFGTRLSCSINTLKLLQCPARCQQSQGGSRTLTAAPERPKPPQCHLLQAHPALLPFGCAAVTSPEGHPLSPPIPSDVPIPSDPAPRTPHPYQALHFSISLSEDFYFFFFFTQPSNIEMIFIKFAKSLNLLHNTVNLRGGFTDPASMRPD